MANEFQTMVCIENFKNIMKIEKFSIKTLKYHGDNRIS